MKWLIRFCVLVAVGCMVAVVGGLELQAARSAWWMAIVFLPLSVSMVGIALCLLGEVWNDSDL